MPSSPCMCCNSRFVNKPSLYFKKYVCFKCRIVNGSQYYDYNGHKTCPRCHSIMTNAGMKFAPPKKSNIKEWNYYEKNWRNSDFS